MVDPNTRQGKRTPVTLKIKFKSETLEQFIERYAVDVSQGGIFIRTKEPLAVGTQMKFEFQLRDASPLIAGEGTVVWTRENDPSRPAIAPGMGVRFDRLAEGSQGVLERILSEKAKQSPSRPSEITKPPMFTDTPTRVAPAPVQEALLGKSPAARAHRDSFSESSNTPLPRPMPFHSDADDFDERAFEEATKVRSLDELAAQSANPDNDGTATTSLRASEEPERKRADSTIADPPAADPIEEAKPAPVIDRDSAPGLPSPPVATQKPKVLDTPPAPAPSPLLNTPPVVDSARTRLGLEPARVETRPRESTPPANVTKDALTKPSGMQAVAKPAKEPVAAVRDNDTSQRMPAERRPSSAPIIIAILVAVAAIAAGVWFFVIRPGAEGDEPKKPTPGSNVVTPGSNGSAGSAVVDNGSNVVTPGSNGSAGSAVVDNGSNGSAGSAVVVDNGSNGSAGSAVVKNGSNGSAGSAVAMTGSNGSATRPPPPQIEMVDTVIASNVEKATVEIDGKSGPAPFTVKLVRGRAGKAKVSAPHYLEKMVDVKGGEKAIAKLDAKPVIIHVISDPAGANVYIDNALTPAKTPGDVTLTAAQAGRKAIHVQVRMGGKRPVDQVFDLSALAESADKLTGTVDVGKLATFVAPPTPRPPPQGSNTGSGSDATPTNGSATPPTPPPPTGSDTAKGSANDAPEPDWTKRN